MTHLAAADLHPQVRAQSCEARLVHGLHRRGLRQRRDRVGAGGGIALVRTPLRDRVGAGLGEPVSSAATTGVRAGAAAGPPRSSAERQ